MDTFGEFFKRRRLLLGLKLREFCRKSKLDPGNISRLERGIAAPPQDQAILREYAKALGVKARSGDWKEFCRLASVANGNLPPEITRDELKHRAVEAVRTGKVRRISRPGKVVEISAEHLDHWSDTLDARSEVPRLVRALAQETLLVASRIAFPAGEGVQRPGWDGIVQSEDSRNPFVPLGLSVWEMGVDERVDAKANRDFEKRSAESLGVLAADTTFVFVTPRRWHKKEKWVLDKKRLRIWKDVRAIDADDLEQWLESAPATSIWFAERLGIRPPGVRTIREYWADLQSTTEPSLMPDVFCASRSEMKKSVVEWLDKPAASFPVKSRSPVEVIDFLAAFFHSNTEVHALRLARTLVVESRESWEVLAAQKTPLILVATPRLTLEAELVASAVRQGHHVLVPSNHFSNARGRSEELPRVIRHELKEALVASGYPETEADQFARASGGSLTILKRLIAVHPTSNRPDWSDEARAAAATPFVWLGGWDGRNDADRKIVERFSQQSYSQAEQHARHLAECVEPLLLHAADRWALISPDEAWSLLARSTSESQLQLFGEVAVEVLGELDPQFDLQKSERWLSHARGAAMRFSGVLRTSIAETLALLAAFDEFSPMKNDPRRRALDVPSTWNVSQRVESIVRKILPPQANWKRWASLNDVLPLLAEAAPDAFLRAVEADLKRGSESQIVRTFRESGSGLFGGVCHTGLLWGLEMIAWSSRYFARTCRVLIELDELLVDLKSGNNPRNSLEQIFLPWYPQTNADVHQRLQVIDDLLTHRPKAAWHFVCSLLPEISGGIAMPIYRPQWRDWATQWSPSASNHDYWAQVDGTADRLLNSIEYHPDRWYQLLDEIERFPHSFHERITERLTDLVASGLEPGQRDQLRERLREKVSRHRATRNSNWRLPEAFLNDLEGILAKLDEASDLYRDVWLFEEYPDRFMHGEGAWKEREEKLRVARTESLNLVLEQAGFEGVVEFARRAKASRVVGYLLAQITNDKFRDELLPTHLVGDDAKVVLMVDGFVWSRYRHEGLSWLDTLDLKTWTSEQAATFLAALPFQNDIWSLAESMGSEVSRSYWSKVGGFAPELSSEDVEFVVAKLLACGRSSTAVCLLAHAIFNKRAIASDILLQTLESLMAHHDMDISTVLRNRMHDVQAVFAHLQTRDDVNEGRLAALELQYVSILDDEKPLVLHRLINDNPKMFVDCLSRIFRSRNEEEQVGFDEAERKQRSFIAGQVYRVLHSWNRLPGQNADGSVVFETLWDWVETARNLAKDCGRLEVCDSYIGQLFARAAYPKASGWPNIAVCKVIENLCSDDLERGFYIGIRNERGVTSRSLYEGGKQEREEADLFDRLAAEIALRSPRAAAVLRDVAESYRRQALREDEEAEWRIS